MKRFYSKTAEFFEKKYEKKILEKFTTTFNVYFRMVSNNKQRVRSSSCFIIDRKNKPSALKLNDWWTFYYDERPKNKPQKGSVNYEDLMQQIGSFNTVQVCSNNASSSSNLNNKGKQLAILEIL